MTPISATTNGTITKHFTTGDVLNYDSKVQANGDFWISYVDSGKVRHYVAIQDLSTMEKYGTDSNNFDYQAGVDTTQTTGEAVEGTVVEESGTFTVTTANLNVRSTPSTSSDIQAHYTSGNEINYDQKIKTNGYFWISYVSESGIRHYVAIEDLSTGDQYGTDSHNFDYPKS